MSRFKRVIGDALRFRTDPRRATEVAIAVDGLNRMLNLGRPEQDWHRSYDAGAYAAFWIGEAASSFAFCTT